MGELTMKNGLKTAAAVMAAALALSLCACSAKPESKSSPDSTGGASAAGSAASTGLKNAGTLVMGTEATFQPFEYMDKGNVVGIDVEIAKQIAKDQNAALSIQNVSFDSVIPAVETGKFDLGVAGITKTAERAKMVDFSDSYYDASQVIIVKSSNTAITSGKSLKGKKIAVQQGTTGDDLAVTYTGASNVTKFQATTDAVQQLENNKVDAVILDSFPAQLFVKQHTDLKIAGSPLDSEQYCIAIKKGNTALVNAVNKTIKRLKDSGAINSYIKQFSKIS